MVGLKLTSMEIVYVCVDDPSAIKMTQALSATPWEKVYFPELNRSPPVYLLMEEINCNMC